MFQLFPLKDQGSSKEINIVVHVLTECQLLETPASISELAN